LSSNTSFRGSVEQRFGLLRIARIEALGKPAVDWSEEIAGLIPLALIAPEARKFCGILVPGSFRLPERAENITTTAPNMALIRALAVFFDPRQRFVRAFERCMRLPVRELLFSLPRENVS
jgi:hypothetical protein